MRSRILGLIGALLVAGGLNAGAATINILWYTGGTEASGPGTYEADVNALVAAEENPLFNVSGSVNTWNVTFWTGGAMPTGSFNALVVASPQGGWSTYPDYTSLTSSVTSASFGDRVMLTGQDADWHYMNYPGPSAFDGPAGFLIDAINWAGSGTGMGGLLLADGGSEAPSTVQFMYSMFAGVGSDVGYDNTVNIPSAYASFPINTGLTSAGLSDWSTSAHASFSGYDSTLWTAINVGPDLVGGTGAPITLVSAATASGGTGGSVPDSTSTAGLLFLGLALTVIAGSRLPLRLAALVS